MPTKTTPGSTATANVSPSMPSGPSRLDLRLAWARQVLNVHESATPDEVRRKFLSGLACEDFVPGEAWQQAYLTLADEHADVTDVTEPAEFLREEADVLSDEIDQFARRMFSLPFEPREREFNALMARAIADSPARARLDALRPGIAADTSAISAEAPLMFELVGYLVELFPLRPVEKAARRAEIVEALLPEIDKWETAARIFKSQQPQLAALDETLIERLGNWSRVEKQIATRAERPIVVTTASGRAPSSSGSNSGLWIALVVGFFVISGLLRAVTTGSRASNSSYPSYSSPSYRSPVFRNRQEVDDLIKRLQEDARKSEIKRFELRPEAMPEERSVSPTLSSEELEKLFGIPKPEIPKLPAEAPEESGDGGSHSGIRESSECSQSETLTSSATFS